MELKRNRKGVTKITPKVACEIMANSLEALGRPRSAVTIATYFKEIYKGLNKYVRLIDSLLDIKVSERMVIAELLYYIHGCILDLGKSRTRIRRPLRRIINYYFCGNYKECDEILGLRVMKTAEVIDELSELIELHGIVNSKTDNEILDYINDLDVDILSGVETTSDIRTMKHIKLTWDISRITSRYDIKNDLKVKMTRTLWGDWAPPLAGIYILKEELDERLLRLVKLGDNNKREIADILVEIDIKIFDSLKVKVEDVHKMWGRTT